MKTSNFIADKIVMDGLTYDDVLLVPAYSEVLPRTVELKTKFSRNIELQIPFVTAAMDTVTEAPMAIAMNPKYLFCDEPNSGLDPKTSLVIDELIHTITHEFNITTIINTHDMNSVMGIGEHILYIHEGYREWEGTKDEVLTSTNKKLNNFIFASDLFKKVKELGIELPTTNE